MEPETTTEAVEETANKFDISILWDKLIELGTNVGGKLIGAILVLVIGAIFIRILMKALRKSKLFNKTDATVAKFLLNFIKIALEVLLIVSVVGILGVPLTSVVAVIASAGVTIGLALQGALSNLAGGIMILIFKPFKIGNYIVAAGHEGTVRDIGIFYTVLSTVDNREVTIPNGTIMSSSIVNVSAYDTRRVDLSISVAYDSDIDAVKTILAETAAENPLVLKDPATAVLLGEHGQNALIFYLRAWVKSEDYWTVNFDLLETVKKRLTEKGIKIPYQQLDVHIDH